MSNSLGWTILDAYFKEQRYPRSRIAIDGYDHFVKFDLPKLISDLNPFVMVKPDTGEKIEIFVGGEDGTHYELLPPVIKDDNNENVGMLPNNARIYDLNYNATLSATLLVRHYDGKEKGEFEINKVDIASFPIMLHSSICALRGLSHKMLTSVGECPYDEGGYFVADGKEKIVVSNELVITNRAIIRHTPEDSKYSYKVAIRTIKDEGGFPRSLALMVHASTGEIMVKGNVSQSINSETSFMLPLMVMFRLLGIETDEDIVDAVRSNGAEVLGDELLHGSLRPSILAAMEVGYSREAAMKHASFILKSKTPLLDAELNRILRDDVLQNVEQSKKANYLAAIVANLLRTMHGADPVVDRDSSINKRVDTGGTKFADLFRDFYTSFRRESMSLMDREYNVKRGEGTHVSKLITNRNVRQILQARIVTDGMRRGMKGAWGAIPGKTADGIVHDVPRYTMHGSMSYLSRLANPMTDTARSKREPHHMHGTQWGVICPIESPDNKDIGLTKHFAVLARVTERGVVQDDVRKCLVDLGMVVSRWASGTPVWLNGTPQGVIADPTMFCSRFRDLRRVGRLHPDVSIAWRPGAYQIEIACDAGRLSRPILLCKDGKIMFDKPSVESWSSLLPTRRHLTKEDGSFATYAPVGEDKVNDEKVIPDTTCFVEYVDCLESDTTMVAMVPEKVNKQHTHCEIQSSTILSPISLLTPFSQHNPSVRNLFSCKQTKACASLYATSFNSRCDNSAHLLHCGQRPLVSTRYAKYFGVDTLTYGVNAIVAIATFTGYNQEDSIIMNLSSVQRGLFNSTHFHTIVDDENDDEENGFSEYFSNPIDRSVTVKSGVSYESLDAHGLPRIGSHIHPGVALVGKVSSVIDSVRGGAIEEDASLIGDLVTHGVVDKVVKYSSPKTNGMRVKIRLREDREPTVGDKFSSRHGQKGIVGRLVKHHDIPFLPDGSVPDLIINPHAIPSRMTIGHLLESIGAKASCLDHTFTDATPLTGIDNYEKFGDRLQKHDSHRTGDELMYNPHDGRQNTKPVNLCPTYYLRLKQMVADKMAASRRGRTTNITGQPAQGRSAGGGLRIGNMESDAITANGMMSFLKESLIERSDGPAFPVHMIQGHHEVADARSQYVPLPEGLAIPDAFTCKVPKAFTVMQKELASMGISMALKTVAEDDEDIAYE